MPHDPFPPPSDPAQDFRPEHSAPSIAPIQTGGPLRRVLPWALSATAVLGLMLAMLFLVLPRLSQVPRPSRNAPVPSASTALPTPPADPDLPPPIPPQPTAAAVPATPPTLSVTLYSAGNEKHVPVGKPVLISAYAALPPGGSATIAISCTRNGGPRSLLTLAQGSLSTASWTPALPGRYDFTASALDSRKISAFSRHIIINADAPLAAARPLPPPVVSPILVPATGKQQSGPRRVAARPVSAGRPTPKAAPAKKVAMPKSASSKALHVAAAEFVVRPVAETLAGALRQRGFHAFVRVIARPHHKPMYAVETGKFLRPADAKKQLYTLNHDGYPAFMSR